MTEQNRDLSDRTWSIQGKILAAMGALIIISLGANGSMLLMGINNLQNQMSTSDKSILDKINSDNADVKARLGEICQQNAETNKMMMRHAEKLAVLETNQNARLEKERRGFR